MSSYCQAVSCHWAITNAFLKTNNINNLWVDIFICQGHINQLSKAPNIWPGSDWTRVWWTSISYNIFKPHWLLQGLWVFREYSCDQRAASSPQNLPQRWNTSWTIFVFFCIKIDDHYEVQYFDILVFDVLVQRTICAIAHEIVCVSLYEKTCAQCA